MYLFFLYLVLFQVKHFVCDYILQGEYMLGKFKLKGWILPLSAHCLVHAVFTILLISPIGMKLAAYLAFFDFVVHFIMDRIKASPNMLGKYSTVAKEQYLEYKSYLDSFDSDDVLVIKAKKALDENKKFWWSLGLDQAVHHLTHYVIILIALG